MNLNLISILLFTMRKKITPLLFLYLFSLLSSAQSSRIDSINNSSLPISQKINLLEQQLSQAQDTTQLLNTLKILGRNYTKIEVYDKAHLYYKQALEIAFKKEDSTQIGWFYEGIGKVALRIGDYQSSLDAHEKAYQIFSNINDSHAALIAEGNIAVVQSKIGPIESSIIKLRKLANTKSLDSFARANTLMTLGNIYLEKVKIPQRALTYYKEILNYKIISDQPSFEVMLLQNIAETYIALEDYENALYYCKKSEEILKENPNLELLTSLHKFYAQIYRAQDNYEAAYKNLLLQQKFGDSLANATTQLKIANINAATNLEKLKSNAKLQENRVNALEREQFISKLKTTILIISLVFLSLITYLIIKKSRQRIKALRNEKETISNKLDFNKNTVEKMAINIATSQEYITSFSQKIKDVLVVIDGEKNKQEVTGLLRELQSYKLINENKKDLKAHLEKVNNDYLFKLNNTYPSLTEEELHLCSLIYLNLKNKEIANLLNLSIRSIENKRYRIRKKMNLTTTESLIEILSDL